MGTRPRTGTLDRRPLWLGLALIALAIALVLVATGLRGPLNPACAGRPYAAECFEVLPTVLMWAALPPALLGAIFIAIWMGRRDEAEGT